MSKIVKCAVLEGYYSEVESGHEWTMVRHSKASDQVPCDGRSVNAHGKAKSDI